jgi:nucleotide-binding universal stress UspA family protein
VAVDYAKAFGAQLILVHVIDSEAFPGYVDWVGDELDKILSRAHQSAKASLDSLADECRRTVKDVKTYCELGSVPNKIVGLADEESADLIVVGTHGRTGVKHLVMGSIARSVLRTAHRPVLIVQAPAS